MPRQAYSGKQPPLLLRSLSALSEKLSLPVEKIRLYRRRFYELAAAGPAPIATEALERIASLIETCKLNGVGPYAYLADVISKIVNGHPNSRIDELLPWAYPAARSLKDVASEYQ